MQRSVQRKNKYALRAEVSSFILSDRKIFASFDVKEKVKTVKMLSNVMAPSQVFGFVVRTTYIIFSKNQFAN